MSKLLRQSKFKYIFKYIFKGRYLLDMLAFKLRILLAMKRLIEQFRCEDLETSRALNKYIPTKELIGSESLEYKIKND